MQRTLSVGLALLLLVLKPPASKAQAFSKEAWPVEANVAGHNVFASGSFDVYSVSPTYFPNLEMQLGNTSARRKIKPKKSWEIRSSYIGLTTTRLPSSRASKIEPYRPISFIDDDPSTIGFAGRPDGDPTTTRAFVRILLPSVTSIQSVVLVPAPGRGIPSSFAVRVHRWKLWSRSQPEEQGRSSNTQQHK